MSEISSTRARDRIREKFMQEALDALYGECGFSVKRFDDSTHQLRGVDLHLIDSESGALFVVDEKAATSIDDAYGTLPTFCCELYSNNNPDCLGWMFQDLDTTHIAFVYPDSRDSFKTLDSVEVIAVPKRRILDMLSKFGIADKDAAFAILEGGDTHDEHHRTKRVLSSDLKLVHSTQLAEQPMCAIISRRRLRKMASFTIVKDRGGNVSCLRNDCAFSSES